jgi:hypothetical protein
MTFKNRPRTAEQDPVPGRKRGRRNWIREISVLVLVIASLSIGHSIYYHQKIDRILPSSIPRLPEEPRTGFDEIGRLLSSKGYLIRERIDRAASIFMGHLEESLLEQLRLPGLNDDDLYEHATETVKILEEYESLIGENMSSNILNILNSAKASAAWQEKNGTLKIWDDMLAFFKFVDDGNLIPASMHGEYIQWMAKLDEVGRRTLARRHILIHANRKFNEGLIIIHPGLGYYTDQSIRHVSLPPQIDEYSIAMASLKFKEAYKACMDYSHKFKLAREPAGLMPVFAVLRYNLMALNLSHLLDHGESIAVMGSEYIADLLYQETTNVVPSPVEMFTWFRDRVLQEILPTLWVINTSPLSRIPSPSNALICLSNMKI